MIDDADGLGPLIEALFRARRPWREANREYITRPANLQTLAMLEALHIGGEGPRDKQSNMAMYVLGMSNILTLMLAGKLMQNIEVHRQHKTLEALARSAWLKVRGSYLWEDATIMRPEELAKHLDKYVPTVPKGMWTLSAKFHIE